MKTKGISFWEQNIERFVIGLAAVVCLVLVAMQFLGEPNAMQVGGKSVSPGEVDAQLIAKAEEVDAQLDGSSNYNFGDTAMPVFGKFDERLNTPVVPVPRMAVNEPRLGLGSGDVTLANRPYRVAKVPTPTDPITQQHFDTIPHEVVEATAGLSAAIGTTAPYDVTWNTVSAKFAIADLLQQFSNDGPNGEAALLLAWYNNRVDFIDLKLEREELINGQWSNAQVINPLPGYFSFRTELNGKKIDDALRTVVLTNTVDPAVRAQIIQPPFYATLTESWVPPTGKKVGSKAIAPDDPAADLKAQREELQAKLDLVKKRLKEMGCPEAAPPEETPPPKEPKPKGGGGGGGAAAPGSGVGSDASGGQGLRSGSGGAVDLSKCKSAWRSKAKFEAAIARLDAEIERITGMVQDKPAEVVEVKDEPEIIIDVWAHDLDIKPGKTYRYRMSIEVYNPLFGRKLELITEQQPLAEQFTMTSEPSAWTEPMTAQPPLRMFVTRALPSNPAAMGMALGQATAEVYRFHNGRWWLESFPVTPGDRVGDVKATRGGTAVDYGTDWYVLDIMPTVGGDDRDTGFGAVVMLQSISDPTKVEWRVPRDESGDPARRTLSGRVKLANLGGEEVAAGGTRTEGTGSATN